MAVWHLLPQTLWWRNSFKNEREKDSKEQHILLFYHHKSCTSVLPFMWIRTTTWKRFGVFSEQKTQMEDTLYKLVVNAPKVWHNGTKNMKWK